MIVPLVVVVELGLGMNVTVFCPPTICTVTGLPPIVMAPEGPVDWVSSWEDTGFPVIVTVLGKPP